jgi:hypothetical protein
MATSFEQDLLVKRARKLLLLRVGLASAAVLAAFFAIYVAYLDRVVTQQFEGRRWTLPAQVFAQPIDLYGTSRRVRLTDPEAIAGAATVLIS